MKRADTTRQSLDCKADEEDGIPIHEILAVIDSADLAKGEEHSKFSLDPDIPSAKRRRDDAAHPLIVDYAISKGVSSVQYVMKTLSESWKYE